MNLMEGHVGALTWPIDGEEAKRDRVEPVVGVVQTAQVLGSQLRYAVRRSRLGSSRFDQRQDGLVAIDRRGRRVNDLRDTGCDAGFQESLRREHVVAGVALEAPAPARPDAGLRGKMVDASSVCQQAQRGAACQVPGLCRPVQRGSPRRARNADLIAQPRDWLPSIRVGNSPRRNRCRRRYAPRRASDRTGASR